MGCRHGDGLKIRSPCPVAWHGAPAAAPARSSVPRPSSAASTAAMPAPAARAATSTESGRQAYRHRASRRPARQTRARPRHSVDRGRGRWLHLRRAKRHDWAITHQVAGHKLLIDGTEPPRVLRVPASVMPPETGNHAGVQAVPLGLLDQAARSSRTCQPQPRSHQAQGNRQWRGRRGSRVNERAGHWQAKMKKPHRTLFPPRTLRRCLRSRMAQNIRPYCTTAQSTTAQINNVVFRSGIKTPAKLLHGSASPLIVVSCSLSARSPQAARLSRFAEAGKNRDQRVDAEQQIRQVPTESAATLAAAAAPPGVDLRRFYVFQIVNEFNFVSGSGSSSCSRAASRFPDWPGGVGLPPRAVTLELPPDPSPTSWVANGRWPWAHCSSPYRPHSCSWPTPCGSCCRPCT